MTDIFNDNSAIPCLPIDTQTTTYTGPWMEIQ